MYRLIKTSLILLNTSDELTLSYLVGNKLKDNPKLVNRDTKYKGVILRIAIFLRKLLWNLCFYYKNNKKNDARVYIYSGTKNQYDSLLSTSESLSLEGVEFKWIKDNYFNSNDVFDSNSQKLEISVKVFLSSIVIFSIKALPLYIKLIKLGKLDEIKYGFDDFCLNYLYIPYFVDELNRSNYELVIMSNDHNQANRCLNLVSKNYGISTAYLQHASVSQMFPKLEFDYSFLDGCNAFKEYLKCENNAPFHADDSSFSQKRKIFLSGQKKVLSKKKLNLESEVNFGIAVNKLDSIEYVIDCITSLIDSGNKVAIRMHPAQNKEFIKEINKFLTNENNPNIIQMNAHNTSLSEYFSFIDVLFASNSSIHLEAALAGIVTIYIDFGDVSIQRDYYGYVSQGLSLEFKNEYGDILRESITSFSTCSSRQQAIQHYSTTYSTYWDGNEGKLVMETVKDILSGATSYRYFEETSVNVSNIKIYGLKKNF